MEDLKTEIARREQNQVQEVRKQFQVLADSVGMSVHEILRFELGREQRVRKQTVRKQRGRQLRTVKFRNPINPEQTWAGRGKRPHWLQQALANGANLEDFSVAS